MVRISSVIAILAMSTSVLASPIANPNAVAVAVAEPIAAAEPFSTDVNLVAR